MDKRGLKFITDTLADKYSYNFSWQGRPIIQYPQDVVAMQELVWKVRPDLIIETGIAHGGSLIFSASMLALLDYTDAVLKGEPLVPGKSHRAVLGIDIDIREHNREAIKAHPLSGYIRMIQGSSVAPDIVERVRHEAAGFGRILVCLDSNHTHEHVLAELEAYAPLVSQGSYCVVFDTIIDDLGAEAFTERPWGTGNSPKSAVHEYLARLEAGGYTGVDGKNLRFEIDHAIEKRLIITVAPDGYLKRIG